VDAQEDDVLMFEEVQRQATCVTTSCEEEGFANAVERFILPRAARYGMTNQARQAGSSPLPRSRLEQAGCLAWTAAQGR
jgi:hypothetical protein